MLRVYSATNQKDDGHEQTFQGMLYTLQFVSGWKTTSWTWGHHVLPQQGKTYALYALK